MLLEEDVFVDVREKRGSLHLKEYNLENFLVVKKNGEKSMFDRDKIAKSVELALRKRPVDIDTKEKLISKIVRDLEGMGENEVSTNTIGEMVMQGLYSLDKVGYVRFASVYRDFRETKDFEQFLEKIDKK